MDRKKKLLKIAVPVLILILGIVIMKGIMAKRHVPEKKKKADMGILVDVLKAEKKRTEITVKGTGITAAARELSLIPEVSGRIVYTSSDMVEGGFVKKDQVVFKIEEADYRLALERANSVKAKAEYDFEEMETRAEIARSEWDRINEGKNSTPNPLVLFEPQLKNARAALASASAQVEQAMLDLNRAVVTAPFDARVRSENIETGQYVRAGEQVAVIADTQRAEISVPFTLDDIRWLNIPEYGGGGIAPEAVVQLNVGGEIYSWKGRAVRSTGEVDPQTRMMKVIVEVKDPYRLLKGRDNPGQVLAPGTFVEVHIKGRVFKDIITLPRKVLHDNSTVWVMDKNGELSIRNVVLLKKEKNIVLVKEGLDEGDMVVLTNISGAADSMKLRTANK
jgi:RND family efflux transporter MFP subunit